MVKRRYLNNGSYLDKGTINKTKETGNTFSKLLSHKCSVYAELI